MNQYLKLIAPAIGATMVAVPFIIADFVSDETSIQPQIAMERPEEKKPVNGSQEVEVQAKENAAPTESDNAEARKEITPAESGKAESMRVAAMVVPIDDEIKIDAAPTELDKAEAKEAAPQSGPGKVEVNDDEAKEVTALTEPDKAEAKRVGALTGPGKVEAKKEAMPTKPGAGGLALTLQTELKRVGCYNGELDGLWGEQSRAALHAFGNSSNIDTTDSDPSLAWVQHVKEKSDIECDGVSQNVLHPQQASAGSGDELRYVHRSQPDTSAANVANDVPQPPPGFVTRDDVRDAQPAQQAARAAVIIRDAQRLQQEYRTGDETRFVPPPQQDAKAADELRDAQPVQQDYRTGDELRYVYRPRRDARSAGDARYAHPPQQNPAPGDGVRYVQRPQLDDGSTGEPRKVKEKTYWGYWGIPGEGDDGH